MPVIIDGPVVGIMYLVKLIRLMTLWISLYIADKVYQTRYVSTVMFERTTPPPLLGVVATALAMEAVGFAFIVVVLVLFKRQNKRLMNTYEIDGGFMMLVAGDYIVTTAVFFAISAAVCGTASSPQLFRYGEDGLRGIRAVSAAVLWIGAIVIFALPAFLILAK